MKASATLAMALILLAAGCSSSKFYWYRPDRSLEEAKVDYLDCQDQARQKAADAISDEHYDRLAPPDGSLASRDVRERAGTTGNPRETQEAWRDLYEQSVLADCMRAKGYMMLRPDRVPRGVHTRNLSKGGVAGR
jgi:hypothetical protein